jgi:transposase
LDWPGYRVYRHEIDESTRTLKLWVRRKRGNKVLVCSGCGGKAPKIEEIRERTVRDLPWRKYQTIVVVEFFRVRCPQCGLKVEQVPQLPGKAPFSKDFEDAVGLACESAAARQVARQFRLPASTVRAIDLRYLERWVAASKMPALVQMGVDEIYLGKKQKFITVASNLETGEPLWFGQERKKETLDEFFTSQLSSRQRMRITAACVLTKAQPQRSPYPRISPAIRLRLWSGNPSVSALSSGRRTAVSCTTSSTSCSTPTGPSMK